MSKATIKDIAKHAGVSPSTVSRYINDSGYVSEDAGLRIGKAISDLNFTPNIYAQQLPVGGSNIVAVVIPDIKNPFFGDIMKGIASVLDNQNLQIILCDTDERVDKELKYLEMLKGQRIKGLLITPTSDSNEYNLEYLNLLESMGTPTVLIDRDVKYSNFDGVFLDSIEGAYQATRAMIDEGHSKIAVITGPLSSKPGRDRLRGYRKALEMNSIEVDERYILHGDFREESGYKLMKDIIHMSERPSGVFISNNLMNLGALKAVFEEKIEIGRDISIVGFDEIDVLNSLSMNISVVARPTRQMGVMAAEILLERLNGRKKEDTGIKRVTLSPELLLHGSERIIS